MTTLPATKILRGQIFLIRATVLAGIWGATQWTAWRLGYQAKLGSPWFPVVGTPIYVPPAFFWWWYAYNAYALEVFVEGAILASFGGFASIAVAIGLSVVRAREAKSVTTYG
jgi:type IV secretion system protein VirD4